MIKLDIAVAAALYVGILGVGFLLAWVFMDRHKFKKYSSDDKYIWNCDVCMHVFVDSTHESIANCPRCASFVKRTGGGGLDN